MKDERKRELLDAVLKALGKKKATNGEVYQLFGPKLFWAFNLGRYDQIQLYDLPEGELKNE